MEPNNRNAHRTRTRLRAAARSRFRSLSYEDVTLRDIASDAGVDASLVSRYFGSKEGLYRDTLGGLGSGLSVLDNPRICVGQAVAESILSSDQDNKFRDAILIILKSAGSPRASAIAAAATSAWTLALAEWIQGPGASETAFLITSTIFGVVAHLELRSASLSKEAATVIQQRLSSTLQRYLDDNDPA